MPLLKDIALRPVSTRTALDFTRRTPRRALPMRRILGLVLICAGGLGLLLSTGLL